MVKLEIKGISQNLFPPFDKEIDDNFIVLSKKNIIKNEIQFKKLNEITIYKNKNSIKLSVRIRIVSDETYDDCLFVPPSLYVFLKQKDLLKNVDLKFKQTTINDIPMGNKLVLRRCYSQLILQNSENPIINDLLIKYFQKLQNQSKDSFFVARDEMIIPIVYNDSIIWFKVISDFKEDFKMCINEESDNFFIDNEVIEKVVSIEKTEYPFWSQFYETEMIHFHYDNEIWPIYEQVDKLLNIDNTCFLIYCDSSDSGLYGKTHLIKTACMDKGLELVILDFVDILDEKDDLLTKFNKTVAYFELFDKLDNTDNKIVFYYKNSELIFGKDYKYDPIELKFYQFFQEINKKYKVIFSSNDLLKTNFNVIRSLCLQEIKLDLIDENQRKSILEYYLFSNKKIELKNEIDLLELSNKTATLTPYEISKILHKSSKPITQESLLACIDSFRNIKAENNGAPKVPNVKWSDIGGLSSIKKEIQKTITLPNSANGKEAQRGILKRSGILLFGVPGSGKTLLAKAIAANFSLNFFSVKGPELLNMYIGESEANIRRVFQKAYECKPCIIFFDELDSIAGKRNSHSGSNDAAMERVVAQLLNEIDEVNGDGENSVFIVGATNRPDLLDEAFTRPGRFDKMIYLGVVDNKEEQIKVLEAVTKDYKLNFDIKELCDILGFNYTGADYKSLSSKTVTIAIQRRIEYLEKTYKNKTDTNWLNKLTKEQIFGNEEGILYLTKEDFVLAIKQLTPSVSKQDIKHYEQLRDKYT